MADPDISGDVTFVQHVLPALESGIYDVTVRHRVTAIDRSKPATKDAAGAIVPAYTFDETYEAQARFAVAGRRWSLDPADIDSVFPAAGAKGEFVNVLPHVVLRQRVLPWERTPQTTAPIIGNSNAHADVASWLALLVFDAAEAPKSPALRAGTLRDLQGAPANVLCYPGHAPDPRLGEGLDDPCRIIDVPGPLFQRIAPSLGDLEWLAHVRRVSRDRKSGSRDGGEVDYAVVIANRLPGMGRESTVHLVSLEGLGQYLPRDDGTAGTLPDGVDTVRLVSLVSWSFEALAEFETFSQVMEAVDLGPLLYPVATGKSPAAPVGNAVAMGYVGLAHALRDGGTTVSWMRGPLAPCRVTRTIPLPVDSADQVLRYDPATGLFDASDALAWQIGRLIALHNKDFAAQLYAWKHLSRKAVIDGFERAELMRRVVPDASAPPLDPTSLRPVALALLRRALPRLAGGDVTVAALGKGKPPTPRASLHAFLTSTDAMANGADDVAPPPALDAFVQDLRHLLGVPYAYLVPDEALLPMEALRFFHVDQAWTDCLVDGALSLGRATEGDMVHDAAHPAARQAHGDSGQIITGFLLRSRAVKHWPGLEVACFAKDGTPLKLLRFDHLAPDVLIGLVDGEFTVCRFHEPPEGLHFGVDIPDGKTDPKKRKAPVDPEKFSKALRTRADGNPTALVISTLPYRRNSTVLAVTALAAAVKAQVSAHAEFTSAEFALEMIEGVGQVTFTVEGA